jgi:hypothetical protein
VIEPGGDEWGVVSGQRGKGKGEKFIEFIEGEKILPRRGEG